MTPPSLTLGYDVPVTHRDLMGKLEPLEEAVAPYRDAGLQVELGGELPVPPPPRWRGVAR